MMKKKTLVIICCFVSSCYAQPRQPISVIYTIPTQKNVAPEPIVQVEQKKSCSIVQEALFEEDDFFDIEAEECDADSAHGVELTSVLSRLQDLVKIFGVQAVLGALYVSEKASESYAWLAGYLNSLNKKA